MEQRADDRLGLACPSVPYSLARRWLRDFIHFFSYHLILARQSTRKARAAGFGSVVRPTVFHPRFFLTSEYFASFIDRLSTWKGLTVAEIGTGSGVLSLAAARAGAARVIAIDINPNAALSRRQCPAERVCRAGRAALPNPSPPWRAAALRPDPVESAILCGRAARRRTRVAGLATATSQNCSRRRMRG